MWGKRNWYPGLATVQTGAAILKISVEVPTTELKIKSF